MRRRAIDDGPNGTEESRPGLIVETDDDACLGQIGRELAVLTPSGNSMYDAMYSKDATKHTSAHVFHLTPRSAFDGLIYFPQVGFYLQMSLSHGYLLRIIINQVREVSIVYCQWIIIAYGIPFH